MKAMEKRFLSSVLPLSLALSACSLFANPSSTYEDDISLREKTYSLINCDSDYSLSSTSINAYFVDGGALPFVDVSSFLSSLDGLYRTEYFSYSTLSSRLCSFSWRSAEQTYSLRIDDKANTITASSMAFFDLVYSSSTTNYNLALKTSEVRGSEGKPKVFDLGAYGIEIYRKKNLVLLPFCVANTIFCSSHYFNLYFNGSAFYGSYFGFSMDEEAAKKAFASNGLGGGKIDEDVASMNAKHFLFVMDNYYGLKEYYGISSFEEYLGESIVSSLSSPEEETSRQAYMDALCYKLDEMHTSFDYPSFYYSSNGQAQVRYGERRQNYLALYNELNASYKENYPDDEPLRFFGDTAIIVSQYPIATAAKSELYDDSGKLKEDAYAKDSFFFMKEMLSRIEKHGSIKHILVDLSRNGGGNVGAVFRVLGLMSDNDIVYGSQNTLSSSSYAFSMKVDADLDGDYDDDDAYGDYEWGLLTSPLTFSAANLWACMAAYSGSAKIFGLASGGGACSIVGFVNADGSSFHISGPSMMANAKMNDDGTVTYGEVQSGARLDKELDAEYFYGHDDKLDALFD